MNEKIIPLRMSRETWLFLKKRSMEKNLSMNKIIMKLVESYKTKVEKKID
jgi:hypothetical protein